MGVEGLFARNKNLSDEELREAAEEVGIEFEEVKKMYDRYRSMTQPHYNVMKDFQTSFKAIQEKKMDGVIVHEDVKPDKDSKEDSDKVLRQVAALLNLPAKQRKAALAGMSKEDKRKLVAAMNNMLGNEIAGMFGETASKSYGPVVDGIIDDYLNYQEKQQALQPYAQEVLQRLDNIQQSLNANAFDTIARMTRGQTVDNSPATQIALKEQNVTRPRRIKSIYDAFTSRRLNQDSGLEITTKEQEVLAENTETAYKHFTSKELNSPPEDNRPKTGNPVYDAFTSTKLNQ